MKSNQYTIPFFVGILDSTWCHGINGTASSFPNFDSASYRLLHVCVSAISAATSSPTVTTHGHPLCLFHSWPGRSIQIAYDDVSNDTGNMLTNVNYKTHCTFRAPCSKDLNEQAFLPPYHLHGNLCIFVDEDILR